MKNKIFLKCKYGNKFFDVAEIQFFLDGTYMVSLLRDGNSFIVPDQEKVKGIYKGKANPE